MRIRIPVNKEQASNFSLLFKLDFWATKAFTIDHERLKQYDIWFNHFCVIKNQYGLFIEYFGDEYFFYRYGGVELIAIAYSCTKQDIELLESLVNDTEAIWEVEDNVEDYASKIKHVIIKSRDNQDLEWYKPGKYPPSCKVKSTLLSIDHIWGIKVPDSLLDAFIVLGKIMEREHTSFTELDFRRFIRKLKEIQIGENYDYIKSVAVAAVNHASLAYPAKRSIKDVFRL